MDSTMQMLFTFMMLMVILACVVSVTKTVYQVFKKCIWSDVMEVMNMKDIAEEEKEKL